MTEFFFDDLMTLFRERNQLVSTGYTLAKDVLAARIAHTRTLRDFLLAGDSNARCEKLFDVCKRTHWTLVSRERLLATVAAIRKAQSKSTSRAASKETRELLRLVAKTELLFAPSAAPTGEFSSTMASFGDFSALLRERGSELIVVRAISDAIAMCGAFFVAEDARGNVFWVHAMDYPLLYAIWAKDLVREGLLIAIKAPSLTLSVFGWDPTIRCGHRSAFVPIYDVSSPLLLGTPWFVTPPESALEWKKRGDACFARGDYEAAVTVYTRGLEVESSLVEMRKSRANALIQLGKWRAALADADRLLDLDDNIVQCHMFRGSALYNLRRYRDSASAWTRAALLSRNSPKHKTDCAVSAADATTRHRQTENVFDWRTITDEAFNDRHIETATYVNPAIHVAPTTIKGRQYGMFAGKNIRRGTLIVVESALVTGSDDRSAFADELLSVAEKDEYIKDALTEMCSAAHIEQSIDGAFDSFGARVDRVGACHQTPVFGECPDSFMQLGGRVSGLLVEVARFNHSCVPNVVKTSIGSVVFLQTAVDVAAGDELFVAQCDLGDLFDARTRSLQERNFTCECTRCKAEATDPVRVRIEGQLQTIADDFRRGRSPLERADVQALIREVLNDAVLRRRYRIALWYAVFVVFLCWSLTITFNTATHCPVARKLRTLFSCDTFFTRTSLLIEIAVSMWLIRY